MCVFGIVTIFLPQLYQNLLLSALLRPHENPQLSTVVDIADAIISREYEVVNSNTSGLSNVVTAEFCSKIFFLDLALYNNCRARFVHATHR